MPTIRKHWRWILACFIVFLLFMPFALVLWAGSEIANPSRRTLQDYHQEYLTKQPQHGIRIDSFTAGDGTPCLVVEPAGNPGERGMKIRQQLAERGHKLPPFGRIKGTLVLVHGRKGRKEDYLSIAERLCAAGFRCVIPDLPAHGDHPGRIATYGVREAALPAMVLAEAARKYQFDPAPAGLMGMSMGGSVAVHAAALPDAPWKALVVIASFDSFPTVIEGQASRHAGPDIGSLWADAAGGIYQQKSGIALADIQPHLRAASIRIPTLVAHGSADRLVPSSAGRRLFAALPATTARKFVEIPDAGHDNVLITDYPIYAEIAEWMLLHVRG
jgi:pimeloyl-ACP methyl ester carboxylesterase